MPFICLPAFGFLLFCFVFFFPFSFGNMERKIKKVYKWPIDAMNTKAVLAHRISEVVRKM